MKNLKYIIVFLFLLSCKNHENHLFYIDDWEDLDFMVNSTNLKELNIDDKIFFNKIERDSLTNYKYKSFGKIHENEQFSVYILLAQMDEPEIHYSFTIETINLSDNKLIESFYLCGYSNDSGELCTGYIDKQLNIFKTCDSHNFRIQKRINTFGKIVDIN